MHVIVNGVRLFFDVEGAKLVADGANLRERQTVILLHGGPGADHAIHKPAWSELADIAQIIYLDRRGNGRSDDGLPDRWTLTSSFAQPQPLLPRQARRKQHTSLQNRISPLLRSGLARPNDLGAA